MNRAFISLYFFIVFSVVVIGWGLNTFWDNLAPGTQLEKEVADLFILLEADLVSLNEEQQTQRIADLNLTLNHQLRVINSDDLADSTATRDLLSGRLISAQSDADQLHWYKLIGGSNKILVLSSTAPDETQSFLYVALIVIFYLAIAVVVFLWLWPLTRDLNRLEKHTRIVGQDGAIDHIQLSPASTVFTLANALNRMATRIRELINSHKEMTSAVTHELRTPLARMKFAIAMASTHADSNVQKQLDSINQDVWEMENLITSLLNYAGFEQQSQQLDCREGHMKDLVEEIIARLQTDNHRAIKIEIRDKTPNQSFLCEWTLMERAILNVIQNGLRFAHSRIVITLEVTDTEHRILLDDDGPGVPLEQRERIFESFVRLYKEDQSSSPSGFGLGLAIVKRILIWHGGDVAIINSPLGGACFYFHWPKHGTGTLENPLL